MSARQRTAWKVLGYGLIVLSGALLTFFYDAGAWLLAGLAMTGGVVLGVVNE